MEKTADAQMPTVGSQSPTFEMVAKTLYGLEDVLAGELTALGANDIQIGRRMVSFTGDKELLYRANFSLRTALRQQRKFPMQSSLILRSTMLCFLKTTALLQ